MVSRAVLSGDLDNDGDVDLVVTNNSNTAQVLRNDAHGNRGRWIGLDVRLGVEHGHRPALGATIDFGSTDPQPRRVRVHNDGGYASASDHRIVRRSFDKEPGASPGHLRFTVNWPDGTAERFALPWSNSYRQVIRGEGEAQPMDRTKKP